MAGYPDPAELADADWLPLVPRAPLRGNTRNLFEVDDPHRFTHVRLRIYPDGGMARLRLPGRVAPNELARVRRRWSESLPPAHTRQLAPSTCRRGGAWSQ